MVFNLKMCINDEEINVSIVLEKTCFGSKTLEIQIACRSDFSGSFIKEWFLEHLFIHLTHL